jgi:N6-L-threonylcarbamoyladenine synthase
MLVLGIESSCDDTSAALVNDQKQILSHVTLSQIQQHKKYGGVVPEIASRAHLDALDLIIKQAMDQAGLNFNHLDAVAVTAGPGLIGGVIVGVMTAKVIASVAKKPFIAVNHLEGHALTARLTNEVQFPFLLLLVSGGHCQILIAEAVGQYRKLGGTLDDAVGEAFDKVAKMMGLGYPGGPIIEQIAQTGNAQRFKFPLSMTDRNNCDFSFSGLKTAVKRQVDALGMLTPADQADIAASFQHTACAIIENRLRNAIKLSPEIKQLVVAGGVAANQVIRNALTNVTHEYSMEFIAPPVALCTDNAAMIAWAGIERFRLGLVDDLSFAPRARWPITELL